MAISITERDGTVKEVDSPGVAAGGLTTGIIGTSLGALALFRESGLLGGLIGGCGDHGRRGGHDAALLAENAALKGCLYTDNKYEKLQGEICRLNAEIAVEKQKTHDNFAFLNFKIDADKKEVVEWVKGHYVPGKLVMPLDALCPKAMPACEPRRCERDEFDNRP